MAEGHSILGRKIDSLSDNFDDFKKETKTNFELVFEHFSNIEDETMEIKAEINAIRRELKSKADLDRLTLLEDRVTELERKQMVLREESKKNYTAKS